ncbi:MAG TPA: exodeoxyribonuclease VII large subunit [Nitrospirae bacterium]|nr:exodeoxyribonuclease VII large subunit [Nitrospirota bacterium]
MVNKPIVLSEFLGIVREVIKQNMPNLYWIIAEISEAKENQKGHFYLTLVEKKDDKVLAQIKGNIWSYEYRKLLTKFKKATGEGFKVGMKVLLLVGVDYHEVYGMSLLIKDVDPSYTLGEMALKKMEIIERLRQEGLIDLNKRLDLPIVPQRIAIISSPNAAGYEDFLKQLTQNQQGYFFYIELFPSLMQGDETETTLINRLNEIEGRTEEFDIVVIIRGGGSTVDLSCFDNYNIAKRVAQFPLPVITGIGHEKDETVLDIVAHTSLKTPTAVADFLLSGSRSFEEEIIKLQQRLKTATTNLINQNNQWLQSISAKFIYLSKNYSTNRLNRIYLIQVRLQKSLVHLIHLHQTRLTNLGQAIRLLSPENILQRGYSITYLNGKIIKDISQIKNGSMIETRLKDASFQSMVKIKKGGGNKKIDQINLFSSINGD